MLTSTGKRALTILLVTTLLVVTAYCLVPREQLLLPKARRVGIHYRWAEPEWMWISDHEAICSASTAVISTQSFFADGKEYGPATALSLYHVDINSGIRTPLDALNHRYEKEWIFEFVDGNEHASPAVFSLSPDGKRLLFYSRVFFAFVNDKTTCISVRLDGTEEVRWRPANAIPDDMLWLSDSKQWLEPVYLDGKGLATFELDRYTLRDSSRPAKTTTWRVSQFDRDNCVMMINLIGNDRVCIASTPPGSQLSEALVSVHSLLNPTSSQSYTMKMPFGGSVGEMAACRVRDRIAFVNRYERAPAWAWIRFKLGLIKSMKPQAYVGIWVSDLDGSNMTEIGHVRVADNASIEEEIGELQWLPSARQISFVFKNAEYVVPVE